MPPRKSKASDLKADHDPQEEHEEVMREDDTASDAGELDTDPQAKRKVEVVDNRTIVNGHVLASGTVIEMRNYDIELHRAHGVPLADVSDDDSREVYDVSELYIAQEGV